jgi:hypothetical protein
MELIVDELQLVLTTLLGLLVNASDHFQEIGLPVRSLLLELVLCGLNFHPLLLHGRTYVPQILISFIFW